MTKHSPNFDLCLGDSRKTSALISEIGNLWKMEISFFWLYLTFSRLIAMNLPKFVVKLVRLVF
jgi:hypothetical protein